MPASKEPRGKGAKPKQDNPFGAATRERVLAEYFAQAGPVTPANAWQHVYRLLLSMDRRTKLVHVYDANHMQPRGNFHSRAVRFTELLCEELNVDRKTLAKEIDRMFQACVEVYLSRRSTSLVSEAVIPIEEASSFVIDVCALLVERFGVSAPDAAIVAAEIERRAEDYFTIGQKRQNVRGEGFEDTLSRLLRTVALVPTEQLRVRTPVNELPGFRRELPIPGKRKREKVPKPDLTIVAAGGHATLWILTAKWSLRQDRLEQFAREFAVYRTSRTQEARIDIALVTNEMDVARLDDVLAPPPGDAGFHFQRVYHVNAELLERTHEQRFEPLRVYRQAGRLLSLRDLLVHAQTEFAVR